MRRDLNVPSVSPTYDSSGLSSSVTMVAWYTTHSLRHIPDSGQFSFFRQLHSLGVAGFFSAALLSTALLCALMIAMVLGMQL